MYSRFLVIYILCMPVICWLPSGCNARVDLANAEGFNALHEAVRRWNVPIVQYLVDNGANPTTTVSVG